MMSEWYEIHAEMCLRISKQLLEEEKRINLWFEQEYLCAICFKIFICLIECQQNRMNSSNGSVLLLCGVLMIVALLLVFRHVRWPRLPLPIVLLGIICTVGAMGFFYIG